MSAFFYSWTKIIQSLLIDLARDIRDDLFFDMKKPLFYIVGWVTGSSVAAVGIGLVLIIETFSYSEINQDPTILIRWLSGWAITGTIVGFIKLVGICLKTSSNPCRRGT